MNPLPDLTPEELRPLRAAPRAAGVRHGGAAPPEGRARAVRRAPAASARPWRSTWRRPASARSAWSTSTSSTPATCSGRSCTARRTSAGRKVESARDRLLAINPDVEVETYHVRLSSENALDLVAAYDVIVDGADNFPTRYLVNDACVLAGKPNAYGAIFRFEGQASVFATTGRPVLPLPVPGAAAAGRGAVVRRGRRARRAARPHRHHPGHRGDQADHRDRRAPDRASHDLRRAADDLPRAEAPEGPGLPGVRDPPDRARAHRLRRVLRPAAAGPGARARVRRPRFQHHRRRPQGAHRPRRSAVPARRP